jgi:hypothetical protein
VAELADAADLKSAAVRAASRFDPGRPYLRYSLGQSGFRAPGVPSPAVLQHGCSTGRRERLRHHVAEEALGEVRILRGHPRVECARSACPAPVPPAATTAVPNECRRSWKRTCAGSGGCRAHPGGSAGRRPGPGAAPPRLAPRSTRTAGSGSGSRGRRRARRGRRRGEASSRGSGAASSGPGRRGTGPASRARARGHPVAPRGWGGGGPSCPWRWRR